MYEHCFQQFYLGHPWSPRGSHSGREKGGNEGFQVRAKESLGTDSHRAISKNSSGFRVLSGHKKCFVLLFPIYRRTVSPEFFSRVRTRRLLSRSRLVWLMHQRHARSQETFSLLHSRFYCRHAMLLPTSGEERCVTTLKKRLCSRLGDVQFDIKSPSHFKILSARKLKTLFQIYKLELKTGIHACICHVLCKY